MSTDRLRRFAAVSSRSACALLASSTSSPARRRPRRLRPVTFTKDIAPILQRSCQECHHAGRCGADVARHLRRSPAVGAGDEDADRAPEPARRDAAVLRREEHRHPEVQARSVAERRGDREDRDSGPTAARRAATPPTCRSRSTSTTTDKWTIGEPDLILKSRDVLVPAAGPGLVGRHRPGADRSDRRSLRVGRRSARGERHSARAARRRPSADATSSIT